MTTTTIAPETKSDPGYAALSDTFEEFMSSFSAFREENDRRLREIETRKSADPLTTEKVERISETLDRQKRVLDDLALKRARPALEGRSAVSAADIEHKEAFEAYTRGRSPSRSSAAFALPSTASSWQPMSISPSTGRRGSSHFNPDRSLLKGRR